MKFRKEDRAGLLITMGVHILMLVVLSLLTVSASERQPMGFLEVEFGPLAEGRPVQQAPVREQPEPEPEEEQPEEVEQTPISPPEDVKPVDLPDAEVDIEDEEVIDSPQSEVIAPQESNTEEEEVDEEPQEKQQVVRPLGSGSLIRDDGADSGDEGSSNEDQASAPYQIEGLNRDAVNTPLPVYVADRDVRATVRIEVDPRGYVVRVVAVVRGGDPEQDRMVLQVVRNWRFNPLPATAPQVNQNGTVTFVFRRR